MERVLEVYEKPYDAEYPVVCMDESPKQIIDYKEFIDSSGRKRQDSEYIRLGVAEIFVAFEPLAGFREMTVENDHKTDTWVSFIALMMDTVYKMAKKVTAAIVMVIPNTDSIIFQSFSSCFFDYLLRPHKVIHIRGLTFYDRNCP
jgi:hypothetical protein